jgi:hypothetical protein
MKGRCPGHRKGNPNKGHLFRDGFGWQREDDHGKFEGLTDKSGARLKGKTTPRRFYSFSQRAEIFSLAPAVPFQSRLSETARLGLFADHPDSVRRPAGMFHQRSCEMAVRAILA